MNKEQFSATDILMDISNRGIYMVSGLYENPYNKIPTQTWTIHGIYKTLGAARGVRTVLSKNGGYKQLRIINMITHTFEP